MLNSLTPNASGIKNMYTRFSWRYGEPNGIVKGLEEFKVIYEFVSNDKPILLFQQVLKNPQAWNCYKQKLII